MGKSSQPTGTSQTNSTSTTQLPSWVDNAAQTNLANSYNVANNLLGPYTGATYAGLTNGANADIAGLQSLPGSSQPATNLAQNTAGNLTGYQAAQVNPGSIASTDLSPYMNPYTQDVIGSGLQAINTQGQQALNQDADQAISQGAFGGSRQGVQEGVTNAATALQAGQLASQLQNQNFTQAQAAAGQDVNTNLQGQLANQTAQQNAANTQLNAAGGLGSLATNSQNNNLTALQAALQGQALSQANTQGQLTADQNAYSAAQQFPIQQLQIPSTILAETPYGSTTTGQSTTQTSAPGSTGLQGVGAGLGILGSLFGGSGGGIVGGLASAFSDKREKTDIQKLGMDENTNVPVYAYRYKSDPKTYPKVIGPMAQDVEKKYPEHVTEINGKKVISNDFMNSMNMGQSKVPQFDSSLEDLMRKYKR